MNNHSKVLGRLSLMCGILSILPALLFITGLSIGALGSVYFAIPMGIVGIVLSRLQSRYADNQISEAGLITSIMGICLNVIIFVMFVNLFN